MVTIKDVAREANVSIMTVSRAFKSDSVIKKETREKILEVANRLNYTPNYNARGLVSNRQFSIGLFFSSMKGTSEVFLGDIVAEMYGFLPDNYLFSVNSIDQLKKSDEDKLNELSILRRFDGIIIISQTSDDDEIIQKIHEIDLPFVVMNRLVAEKKIYQVYCDENSGIEEMIHFLSDQKIKSAGVIKGYERFYSSEYRYQRFSDYCRREAIELQEKLVIAGEYSIDSGYESMKRMISQNKKLPDIIFCCNDDMAIGAIKACKELKINVPEDLSLIGFDDIKYSQFVTPALTTVKKPYQEMARKSMEVLLKLMDGEKPKIKKHCLKSQLIIRESVKKSN